MGNKVIKFLKDSVNRVIPKFKKKDNDFSFAASKQWLDSSRLTVDVYDELYERNGLAYKLVNKLANDRFAKWFDLKSDSDEFKKKAHFLNSDKGLKIRSMMTLARKYAMRHGYCLLFLGCFTAKAIYM